jgi:hypothetical protein
MNATCGQRPIRSAQKEDREMALGHWQEHIHQLRLLVERAHEFTPSSFVKRVHEALPELRWAAMGAVIHIYVNSGPKEE